MSEVFELIKGLVASGTVRISDHGYDELAADGLTARDLIIGVASGEVLEDYPLFPKGPCCLVLQYDSNETPVHTVWGIPSGHESPAVLLTAYRPVAEKWDAEFRRRKK